MTQTQTKYTVDLSQPLVLDYARFFIAEPTRPGMQPCVHGWNPRNGAPRCGSLWRSDPSSWEMPDRAAVEMLFRMEQRRTVRTIWFCQNCVASNTHPLAAVVSDHERIDEFIADVDAAIERGEVRMLLWFCPSPTHRGVTWARNDDGTATPTCTTCGQTGDPQ
jgi:hypothetical protein